MYLSILFLCMCMLRNDDGDDVDFYDDDYDDDDDIIDNVGDDEYFLHRISNQNENRL